jgi:hypothetical protein
MSNPKSSPPHLPSRFVYSKARSLSKDEACSLTISPILKGKTPKDIKELVKEDIHTLTCLNLAKDARKENDAMVYLDGPRIYTCGECRTHLTSHDEIISKSFHGRNGTMIVSCLTSFLFIQSYSFFI